MNISSYYPLNFFPRISLCHTLFSFLPYLGNLFFAHAISLIEQSGKFSLSLVPLQSTSSTAEFLSLLYLTAIAIKHNSIIFPIKLSHTDPQ